MTHSFRKRLVGVYLSYARNYALQAWEKHANHLPPGAYAALQRATEAILEAEARVLAWEEGVPDVEETEPEGTYRVIGTDSDGTRRVMAAGMGYKAAHWFAEQYLGSYFAPDVEKEEYKHLPES